MRIHLERNVRILDLQHSDTYAFGYSKYISKNSNCCCCCCCEIPDHRVVPTVGTSLVSLNYMLLVFCMVFVTCVSYMNILMHLWLYFVLSLDLIIVSLLLLKVISVYYHWVSSFVSLSSLHYLLYCCSCCCLLVISSCSC